MNFPWNKDMPLGLPEGSVRALFSGSIVATFCAVVVLGFIKTGQFPVLPDFFTETFFGALAYYGLVRHGAPVAAAMANRLKGSEESNTEAEMKAEIVELRSKQVLEAMKKADQILEEFKKRVPQPAAA